MIKEKLEEDLFDKLPDNGRFVLFGACAVGEKILNDLKIYKPNANVVGFIDNLAKGTFLSLPVWNLKEFLETTNINYDLVIMTTRKDFSAINTIFDLYEIPYLPQSNFVSDYYRNIRNILTKDNLNKVLNIFKQEEDKELYKMLFRIRAGILESQNVVDYFRKNYVPKDNGVYAIKWQYLEKINKSAVKTVFDIGLYTGLNVIAYNKLLPNLQNTYGFETIYDRVRTPYIENFILDKKLCIVPYALGDKEQEVDFYINTSSMSCSYCDFSKNNPPKNMAYWEKVKINVTTIDKYCSHNNVVPDFIKMDIEGAEREALKGGIETIKKCRPQLAISIYHSNDDFIKIPLYLYESLENYIFKLGHYAPRSAETVLYAIPKELA